MENDEKDGKYYDKRRKTQIWVECAQNVCQKAGEQQSGLRVGGVALLFSGGGLRISAELPIPSPLQHRGGLGTALLQQPPPSDFMRSVACLAKHKQR